MTSKQKDIIEHLLQGCTIASLGPSGIRLRTPSGSPIMKISPRSMWWIKRELMRRDRRTGLWVVDKRKVRSLHGNCFAKRIYKSQNQKS